LLLSKRTRQVFETDAGTAWKAIEPARVGYELRPLGLKDIPDRDERLFVGNAAVEALGGKDAKFGFRQIKPTAVLRRIVPFEPLDQPCFSRWEGLVKWRWYAAELNRTAGEIVRSSQEPDATKAETYFERALAVARQQQAKSWELRASMSLARLWRDQGKVQQARELLAPVYGWFTEGFETRDLKEAKALLEELAA
jgi:hypothetical protein